MQATFPYVHSALKASFFSSSRESESSSCSSCFVLETNGIPLLPGRERATKTKLNFIF